MTTFNSVNVTSDRGPAHVTKVGWRFFVIKPGGRQEEITPTTTGSVSYDDASNPRMALTGLAFLPYALEVFDPVTDYLQVYLQLDEITYNMGIWYATALSRQKDVILNPDRVDSDGNDNYDHVADIVHIDFSDGFVRLQASTEVPIVEYVGADPALIMRNAAEAAGFSTAVAASAALLGDNVTWDAFTSYYEIIESMYEVAGHRPPWVDRGGVFRSVRADLTSIEHIDLFDLNPTAGSIVISENFLSAPNRVVVYDDQAEYPLVGVWNAPSSAPHSFANRGYYITQASQQQGLSSIAAAIEVARTVGETLTARTLNVEILPTAVLDGPKILEYDDALWLVRKWSLGTSAGSKMTVEATELIQ